jgi:hypothetical protein
LSSLFAKAGKTEIGWRGDKAMRSIKIGFTAVLFLLLAAFVWAQEPQRDERKPRQQEQEARPPRDVAPQHEPAQDEARPPRQQQEMKPPRQEMPEKQESGRPAKDEARPAHEQRGQERQGQEAEQRQRPRPARGKGTRIPEEKFRATFGRQHTFVINRPVVIEGQPRFQYAAYWFEIYDPWPAQWAYTDDFYIDYVDDDYYLFDALHPGFRVLVIVVG